MKKTLLIILHSAFRIICLHKGHNSYAPMQFNHENQFDDLELNDSTPFVNKEKVHTDKLLNFIKWSQGQAIGVFVYSGSIS